MIAFEGGDGAVKEISRIQRAVAKKFVHVTVKRIGSRARYRIDYTSGSPSVIRRIVAPQNGDLLHGVDAEIIAKHAARGAVRVVIDADTVEPIAVLIRPRSRDAHGRAKSAVNIAAASGTAGLHTGDPGLQSRELRPIASV